MTGPQPTASAPCPTCGPGYRYGDDGCRHEQPTASGEVLTSEDWDAVTEASFRGGAKAWRAEIERILTERVQAARDEERARAEDAERRAFEAQEHIAYHLRDFRPTADHAATGDLAVDMVAYADRWKARALAAETALLDARGGAR